MSWTPEEQARARKAAKHEMARLFPLVGKCEGSHKGCRLPPLCRCMNSACNCNAGCYAPECRDCYPEGMLVPVRKSRSSGRMSSGGSSGNLAGRPESSGDLARSSPSSHSGALRAASSSGSLEGGLPTAMTEWRTGYSPGSLQGASSGGLGTRGSSSGQRTESSGGVRTYDSSWSVSHRGGTSLSSSGLSYQPSGSLSSASSGGPRGGVPRFLPRGGGGSQRSDAGTELLVEGIAGVSLTARSPPSIDPRARPSASRGSATPSRSGEQRAAAGSGFPPQSRGGSSAASGAGHSSGSGK